MRQSLPLDDLQRWMESSVWGNKTKNRSMQDEWNELAKVVQKPTCEMIRDAKQTYLKLIIPGVSTQEMDTRKLQLKAYQQYRDAPNKGGYAPGPFPLRWRECTTTWISRLVVASKGSEALTIHLPISDSLQTTDFSLALTIAYQLEAERDVMHETCFVLRDLHIISSPYRRDPTRGVFKLDSADSLPIGTSKSQFILFKKEDLGTIDA